MKISCACRMSWPARKTASRWSANATTILSWITTLTFSSFRITSLPGGLDSSRTARTSLRRRALAKCRRRTSLHRIRRRSQLRPNSVEADFAVELGADSETLEFPWAAAADGPRYYDLKRHPELLAQVEEAQRVPELGEFLRAMNAASSILETAKCDAWESSEISAEEEIFGAACKFGLYVDLLFSAEELRFLFPAHEQLVQRLTQLLKRVPEIPAAAEFLIRRCYFHQGTETREGFYITFYLFGYADDQEHAQNQWTIGLKLVENAIRQISASWKFTR